VSVITDPTMRPPGGATLAIVSGTETTTPEEPRTLVPLDPPMVPFALGGMAIWLVALLVTIPFRDTHESWFWICVAGFLWGIPGLITMLRHDARRKKRRAASQP
jgi:hypothetical protein